MLYKECPGSRAVGAVFVSPALQRGEGRFHVRTPESRRDGARTFPLQESIPPGAWSSVPGNNPSQNSWESTNGTKSRQGRRATCSFERARLQSCHNAPHPKRKSTHATKSRNSSPPQEGPPECSMGILPTDANENTSRRSRSRREPSRIAQGNPERSRRGRPGIVAPTDQISPVGATEFPQLILAGAHRRELQGVERSAVAFQNQIRVAKLHTPGRPGFQPRQ